jgi:demethylmenaquinone methyltransferase/2-methoxy-6-polyprenyl-1,4-benzoquinol methylase
MQGAAQPGENLPGANLPAYYARRAAEYEHVYAKPERQADLAWLAAALPSEFAGRNGLELACGTGWWTPHAARDARRWLATDINAEPLAIARAKPMPACVRWAQADAYALHGLDEVAPGAVVDAAFDAAFAGFWWSHVPLQQLPAWLAALHARLQPGARVVFIDNRYVAGSSTPLHRYDAAGNSYQQRQLADGSTHEVLKNFPSPAQAQALLGPQVQALRWVETDHYWLLAYDLP